MESDDADLSVTLIVDKRDVKTGVPTTAVVTVSNHGPAVARAITVRIEILRSGVSVVDLSGGEADGDRAATLAMSEMPPETERHWNVGLSVDDDAADGEYPVVASVASSHDPEPENDQDRKMLRVRGRSTRKS